jgi:hypothetical protein
MCRIMHRQALRPNCMEGRQWKGGGIKKGKEERKEQSMKRWT